MTNCCDYECIIHNFLEVLNTYLYCYLLCNHGINVGSEKLLPINQPYS